MTRRVLYIGPLKCAGCRNCEAACSWAKEGVMNPRKSRVRVVRRGRLVDEPITCRNCARPLCRDACPKDAILINDGNVIVDQELCIGCGACVKACPFGAMTLHPDTGLAINCDLCGECVEACPVQELRIVSPDEIAADTRWHSLDRLAANLEETIMGEEF